MVRMVDTADDSLAAIRARSKLGMAIAAMIRMIATTIRSSISEKPFCFFISILISVIHAVNLFGLAEGWMFALASQQTKVIAGRLIRWALGCSWSSHSG